MSGQRYIPGRRWARGPGQAGRGGFQTRVEGHQRSRKVWICLACRAWLEPEQTGGPKGKPAACHQCGGSSYLFFDSAIEGQRFARLWFMQDTGEITGLKHHPRFELHTVNPGDQVVRVGVYEADSEYWRDGQHIVEDVKPRDEAAQDPLFKWKRRHFEAEYGLTIYIVSKV